MQIGIIGLGRMGANIGRRLMGKGHKVVAFDREPKAVAALTGATGAASLKELVEKLTPPRAVWVMLPAGKITDDTIFALGDLLASGDAVIDGGNTYYKDDIRRAKELKKKNIAYVDCGTSGGVWGLERGYCMMIGGDKVVVDRLDPIFAALAPGAGSIDKTPARDGRDPRVVNGYLHAGPAGAGHFVKMVHNGIEYGLMAAYAEGLNILRNANVGKRMHDIDAETAPLKDAEYYQYDLDLPQIAELWRRGSVIGSWLLDLSARALDADPGLENFAGHVSDSGEGRWTIAAAIDEAVPVPVLSAALFERFSSRGGADFANRVLSALRKEFGGHDEKHASH